MWYRQAAQQGYAPSQFNLGNMYLAGQGVEEDKTEAFTLFRRASDQGLPAATFNLGVLYATGDGVPQDMAKAAQFYRRAAEVGYAEAQANLGVLYASGTGVSEADLVQAYVWFTLAADQGNEPAHRNLSIAAERMTADQVTEAERRAKEMLAVSGGDQRNSDNTPV